VKLLEVTSKSGTYKVNLGQDLLPNCLKRGTAILADEKIARLFNLSPEQLITVEANEFQKSLETVSYVISAMKQLGLSRDSTLLVVGGGFVQDIGTLSSALYMRGIRWEYVPTSFMAMVDSCLGGKSSINVEGYKNLIGNIYPPREIHVDVSFASTLNPVAIACGMSEAIKICYARGPEEFQKFLELKNGVQNINSEMGVELVTHILEAKKWFIESDEFDSGIRQFLNFGHTFGHALESGTSFKVPHGIAIGLGMMAAIDFHQEFSGNSEIELNSEILGILAPVKYEIHSALQNFDSKIFTESFASDKKNTNLHFNPILSVNGRLEKIQVERTEANLSKIKRSMEKVVELW
jgi:3-dehydroquinate synthase